MSELVNYPPLTLALRSGGLPVRQVRLTSPSLLSEEGETTLSGSRYSGMPPQSRSLSGRR